MTLYRLDQSVLKINGNAVRFLNGLTSNTLDKLLNAFLNQHGRIIATFFQQQSAEDEFLVAVPPVTVEDLLQHLDRYAKLSHTQIQHADLKAYMDIDTAKVLFKKENIPNQLSEDQFTLFRLEHYLPFLGVDYQVQEFILNIDENLYVSYTKGCFLGQEPVSKVHSRSKPTRKLVVKFEDECTSEEKSLMTSKVIDPATGRVKGFVFVKNT